MKEQETQKSREDFHVADHDSNSVEESWNGTLPSNERKQQLKPLPNNLVWKTSSPVTFFFHVTYINRKKKNMYDCTVMFPIVGKNPLN